MPEHIPRIEPKRVRAILPQWEQLLEQLHYSITHTVSAKEQEVSLLLLQGEEGLAAILKSRFDVIKDYTDEEKIKRLKTDVALQRYLVIARRLMASHAE